MEGKIIFEDKEREITITEYDVENNIVLKFGHLEVSLNKDQKFHDIAYDIRGKGLPGVLFTYEGEDQKWEVCESVNMISLWYLHEAKRKLETLKEAMEILREKD